MLLALADSPSYVGQDISTSYWLAGVLANVASVALSVTTMVLGRRLFVEHWHMTGLQIFTWTSAVIMSITAGLYVYYVYLADLGSSKSNKKT